MATMHPVKYIWQGFSVHCWLTAVEMLMHYKHGSKYGREPGARTTRREHTENVLKLKNARKGASLKQVKDDFGLTLNDDLCQGPGKVATWDTALAKGPVLAGGSFGWHTRMARKITKIFLGKKLGGHVVLVRGSKDGKLYYLDPFLSAGSFLSHDHKMTPEECEKAVKNWSECFWQAL